MSQPETVTETLPQPDLALVGQTVAAEHEGRVLEGVGVPEASLKETLEARAPEPDQKPDRPTRGQKRFSELTSERDQALARAEAAEKALEAAKKVAPVAAAPVKPEVVATKSEPAAKAVERTPKPLLEQFADQPDPWGAYQEAVIDWKVNEQLATLNLDARIDERLEAERATRRLAEQVRDITALGRKTYPDFEAALTRISDVLYQPWQYQAVLALPNSHDVQYALAQDPALAKRLAAASGVDFGMLLGQLSQSAGAASPASTPRLVPTTTAPAPVQPVGAGSRTATPSLEELAASGNFEAYQAARRAGRTA